MANFFRNANAYQQISERRMLESKYNSARSNLLLVIVFSLINLILLITQSNVYFLFSAAIPYALTDLGMFYCGMYADEYYTGELAGIEFLEPSFFVILLAISLIIIIFYFVCYLLSKKNKVAWLIVALVLFSLDTLVMFWYYGISVNMLLDLAFHVWMIVILALGIRAHFKLQALPPEQVVIEGEAVEISENTDSTDTDGN